MVPQPTPTFIQQRGQNNFGFGGMGQQHQSANALQQQQQQQVNGTSSSLPPHLTQTPNLANAQSASSASEVGLDPNDFPALGSTSTNANNSSGNNNGSGGSSVTTSYASQAGTGVGMGGGAAIGGTGNGNSNQPRDFTADDFPALGGQTQSQGQGQSQDATHSHPPGLNGFQHSEHSHRQNLLGTLSGMTTPGLLNLGPQQARNVHPGFQQGHTDAEKQQQQQRNNFNMKLNQTPQAAWPSSNVNPQPTPLGAGFPNAPPTPSAQQQNGSHPPQNPSSAQHLNAPPGVPPPNSNANPNASNGLDPTPGNPNPTVNPNANAVSNNNNNSTNPNPNAPAQPHPNSTQNPNSMPNSTAHVHQHPQTPAQQILMSAADRWGLLGLLAMIKNAGSEVDGGLSSIGQDLGTMGLDMGYGGSLYSTFITPWADQSAAHTVEPDYHIPACYNVQPPPPGPSKATAFSDETLFFMFYSSPRDALQEVAAQELWNRNWRFHKELRIWITKESGAPASQKIPMGETGQYTYWDPENWMKERKDMTVLYSDLEEKTSPVFLPGPGLVPATGGQQQGQVVGAVQPGQPTVGAQRGSFQMGVAV
ncbi:transcriptional regulator [Marasmius crinis-equi]|uniref:Transcriptional regulator n=1 Tax=Marasmius crinis-equi TaxID=585013 RepID=A0ABR3F5V2_9AGAR